MNRIKRLWKTITDTVLSWNLRRVAVRLTALAIVVGLVTSVFWYREIYMTDERRFWSAVENSMSTPSVVRTLTSGGTGNQVVQDNRFYFGAQELSQSRVEFTTRSSTVNTTVMTEGISTLDSQYSRYIAFDTTDTRDDGTIPNLDSLLGRWSGETASDENLEDARLNYVSELVTLVIFGNFDPTHRQEVLNAFQSSGTYDVNLAGVTSDRIDGEDVIVYPVSVGLRSYAEQLQKSFLRAGLGDFPPLAPENYREDSRLNAAFAVRPNDNTIVGITFGDRQEVYSNYGVINQFEIPEAEFTPQDLEAAVQEQIQG